MMTVSIFNLVHGHQHKSDITCDHCFCLLCECSCIVCLHAFIGVIASFVQDIYTAQESGPVAVCAKILNGTLDRSVVFSIRTTDGSASCRKHAQSYIRILSIVPMYIPMSLCIAVYLCACKQYIIDRPTALRT